MPDIEDYIGQKIPVNAITTNLLADIIRPEKRLLKPKTEYQGKRPNQDRSHKPTNLS
jgi:ATP-dependent RNA helicase RhlB